VDGLSYVQLNTASVGAVQLTSRQSGAARGNPAMDAAAKALGMNSSDLRTALQSGQSLASIASSNGVSKDQLIASMTTAIQQANPGISPDQAAKVATAIATHTPPAMGVDASGGTQSTGGTAATGGHHHRHHAMSAAMDAAAKMLGTTTSDLASSLSGGQSLTSLASSKGVSQADLVKSISSALQGADSNLSADQAGQLATNLATATPPATQGQPWADPTSGPSSTFSVAA
jgi:uncharacterized protein YidB (DUF937 family)